MTPQETLRRALLNDEFPEDVAADRLFTPSGEDALRLNRNIALSAWMSQVSGQDINAGSATWQHDKDALVQGYFGNPTASNVSDEQLHSIVKTHIQTAEESADIAANIALQGKPSSEALKMLNAKRGPSLVRGVWDRYTKDALNRHFALASKLSPYRGIIDSAASQLGGEMEWSVPTTQKFQEVAKTLLEVPEADRQLVISAIGATGGATPEERASYLSKLAGAMGRMIETMGASTVGTLEQIGTTFEQLGQVPEAIASALSGGVTMQSELAASKARSEEMLKAKKDQVAFQILTQQIRQVADSEISPIKGDGWWSQTGIDVARMVPQVAVTVANPTLGTAANLAYFRNTVAAKAKAEDPSLTYEQADAIGSLTAPFNATIETATALIPFGRVKVPLLTKWLSTVTTSLLGAARNIALRSAAGAVSEVGEEMAQEIAPLWTQEALSALQKDMPSVDWERRMPDFSKIAAQTWGPALAFGLVAGGAASISEVSSGRLLTSDRDKLIELGVSPVKADEIAAASVAGDWAKTDALIREDGIFTTATPEEMKEAAAANREEEQRHVAIEEELKRRGELPDVMINPQTGKYRVIDREGNILIETDKRADALNVAYSTLEENQRIAAEATVQIFDELMASRGTQAEGAVVSQRRQTAQSLVDEGIVSYDQMMQGAMTAAQADGVSAQQAKVDSSAIHGFNRTEFWDQVRTMVSRTFAAGVDTAIHETVHARVRRGMANGTYTREMALEWVRAAERALEGKTDKAGKPIKFLPSENDAEIDDRVLEEAVVELAVTDTIGRRKSGTRFTPGLIAQGISARLRADKNAFLGKTKEERAEARKGGNLARFKLFLQGWKETLGNMLRIARQVQAARQEGKLGEDFDAFLDNLLGTDAQSRYDLQTQQEAKQLIEDGKMPFSMNRKGGDLREYSVDAFHGTNSRKFNQFDILNLGKGSGNEGLFSAGFYFSPSSDDAKGYGKNLVAVGLKVKNPLIVPDSFPVMMRGDDSAEYWSAFDAQMKSALKSVFSANNFNEVDRVDAVQMDESFVGSFSRAYKALSGVSLPPSKAAEVSANLIQRAGFDAVYAKDGDKTTEIVVYDPSNILIKEWNGKPVESPMFSMGKPSIKTAIEVDGKMPFSMSRAKPADTSNVIELPDGAQMVGPTMFSIKAYHATPHKVDKFSLSKIGTGEGAQAFGWGLYFAENEAISGRGGFYDKAFQAKLPRTPSLIVNGKRFSGEDTARFERKYRIIVDLWRAPNNPSEKQLRDDLSKLAGLPAAEEALSMLNSGEVSIEMPVVNIYTVELLPDADEFLDWDKPLSEQSEKVKAAVGEMWQNWINQSPLTLENGASQDQVDAIQNSRGSDFYALLAEDDSAESDQGNIQAASKRLASLGIPGIRFLDGGSRGAGDGTRNYVIFDESLVKILEENGKPVESPMFSIGKPSIKTAIEVDGKIHTTTGSHYDATLDYIVRQMPAYQREDMEAAREKAGEILTNEWLKEHNVKQGFVVDGEFLTREETLAKVKELGIPTPLADEEQRNWFDSQDIQEMGPMFSMTPQDREYLAAVEAGDMAKAQAIVDEAAKAAAPQPKRRLDNAYRDGLNTIDQDPQFYDVPEYVGFDMGKTAAFTAGREGGMTPEWVIAERIGPPPKGGRSKNFADDRMERGVSVLRVVGKDKKDVGTFEMFNDGQRFYVAGWEIGKGSDGEPLLVDVISMGSADPVTYDESGNVIPPSQRFNTETPDIRFSSRSMASVLEAALEAQRRNPEFRERLLKLVTEKAQKIRRDSVAFGKYKVEGADAITSRYNADVAKLDQARKDRIAQVTDDLIAGGMDAKEAKSKATLEANEAFRKAKDALPSKKDQQMADLRTLDAILSIFPPEIRGKVGGMYQLAKANTDAAREKEILKRVEIIDKVLEKEGVKLYRAKIEKLFKRYAPKKEAGQKPVGQLEPDAQELVDAASEAMGYDEVRMRAEVSAIDSMLAEEGLSDERETYLERKRELIQLFADYKNADAARLESAADALEATASEGWAKWKLKKIMERERREEARKSLVADTGKPSIGKERDKQNKWAKTTFGKPFSMLLNISSFSELLRFEFGEKSAEARRLEDQERAAAYAYEDAMQAFGDRIGDFFAELAGGRLAGEQLRFDLAQPTLTVGTGDNERTISQLQGIQALLMWQQEDGRRHMEGQLDESGKPVGSWHYGEEWVKDLESKMTPEAYQVKAFLEQLYSEEYPALNALYRQRHGVNLPKNPLYSPLTVQPMQAKAGEMVDPVSGFAVTGSILTPGGLRTRNKRAVAEPRFEDAVQIFLGHSRQMEHWKAYYDFAMDAQAILLNREVTNAVESKGSKQAVAVLKKWVDQFAQGGSRDAQAGLEISNFYSRASGRAARVALLGRISTILIQSTQLAAASVKMPLGAYLKRLGMLLSGNLNYADAVKSPFIQRRYKTAPPIVQQANAGVGDANRPGALSSTTPRILGNALSGADALFTGGTYAILLDYHRTVTGPALGLQGAELESFAQKEAERDTEAVAQPVRAGTRSIFENTLTSPLAKTGFAFASEARQKIALAAWAAYKAKSDPTQSAKVAFLTFIVGGLVTQVIKNLWREAKGDDDEKMWSAERLTKATLAGPLHGIPGVSELMGDPGLFSGFKWSAGAVEKIATKAMEDDLDEVTMRDMENALSAAGYFNDTAAGIAGLSHLGFDFAKILQALAEEE